MRRCVSSGESGCGKSMTALALLRLIPSPPGRISGGRVLFQGEDLLQVSDARMRDVRGNRISMIFQEPMTSLNPVFTVGDQIGESLRLHAGLDAKQAASGRSKCCGRSAYRRPNSGSTNTRTSFSGGMRQRVMIAMALACRPDILIADEPTTALDVTVQAQILDLLRDLQRDKGTAILFITHDMGAVAEMADRVMVMYAGRVVEHGTAEQVLSHPGHPYTQGLIDCLPELGSSQKFEDPSARAELVESTGSCLRSGGRQRAARSAPLPACDAALRARNAADVRGAVGRERGPGRSPARRRVLAPRRRRGGGDAVIAPVEAPLLAVSDLKVHFPRAKEGWFQPAEVVRAVDGVSFEIARGTTLAWSANRAPARPRPRWRYCGSGPYRAGSGSATPTWARSKAKRCVRRGAACKSFSRIRFRR